jgi:hypothetical protein
MPPTTETEIKELRDLVIGLREEMRLGFANVDTKLVGLKADIKEEIQRVESKTDIKLTELAGKIDVIDERTKLGFWGFVGRAIIIAALILLIGFSIKYFFFGTVKV